MEVLTGLVREILNYIFIWKTVRWWGEVLILILVIAGCIFPQCEEK